MSSEIFAFNPAVAEANEFPVSWRWAGQAIYEAIQGRTWDRVEVTFKKGGSGKSLCSSAFTKILVNKGIVWAEAHIRMEVDTPDGLAVLATSAVDELGKLLEGGQSED